MILCFMKYTQQNLEHSSIKVRKYLEPLFDVVGMGPKTSLCIRSSVEATKFTFPTSYLLYGCLATKQLRHNPSDVWMRGKPSTILSLWSCWRYLKLRCPISHAIAFWRCRHDSIKLLDVKQAGNGRNHMPLRHD